MHALAVLFRIKVHSKSAVFVISTITYMAIVLALSLTGLVAFDQTTGCYPRRGWPTNENKLAVQAVHICTRYSDDSCSIRGVLLSGPIDQDGAARVDSQIDALMRGATGTPLICMSSPGGSVKAMLTIFHHLKLMYPKLTTCVAPRYKTLSGQSVGKWGGGTQCASACTWLYLAGSKRLVYGATIRYFGFHEVYNYYPKYHEVFMCPVPSVDGERSLEQAMAKYFVNGKEAGFTVKALAELMEYAFKFHSYETSNLAANNKILQNINFVNIAFQ